MNREMTIRGMAAAQVFAAILGFTAIPALLTGCFAPHVVDAEDTRYCESQGFRPGSDPNYQCAVEREAARDRGEVPPLDPPPPPKPFLAAEPPPDHKGGVSQITPRSIPPDTTRMINFAIAVDSNCVSVGIPKVRIGEPPNHGTLKLIRTTEFARLSQMGVPPACEAKRVQGAALLYTPNKSYLGEDLVDVEVTTPAGARTYFEVPITVEVPDDDE